MVIVVSNWSVKSLLLPLDDVLELGLLVPRSIGNESILVLENPNRLFENISSLESDVGKTIFWLDVAIGVKVGIDSGYSLLVGPIQFRDGIPDLFLNL